MLFQINQRNKNLLFGIRVFDLGTVLVMVLFRVAWSALISFNYWNCLKFTHFLLLLGLLEHPTYGCFHPKSLPQLLSSVGTIVDVSRVVVGAFCLIILFYLGRELRNPYHFSMTTQLNNGHLQVSWWEFSSWLKFSRVGSIYQMQVKTYV